MKRLAVALAAIAVLVGVVRAGDVTGRASRLHHHLVRTDAVRQHQRLHVPATAQHRRPGPVASDMAARGLTGVGNVILNRPKSASAVGGLSLHPGWDFGSLSQAQERFISPSLIIRT